MNKVTRKLVPAIFMLVIALVLSSTASYAWFSMNRTVTATGMSVSAKSNAVFLQIKNSGADDATYSEEVTATGTTALLPMSHAPKTVGVKNYGVATLTVGNAFKPDTWWRGYSASSSDGTLDESTIYQITDRDSDALINDHFRLFQFDVRITSDSGLTSASNLRVSKVTIDARDDVTGATAAGVTIIILGVDGVVEFNGTDGNGSETVLTKKIVKNPTDDFTLFVGIYIDGENPAVTTADITKLGGTISFELTCEAEEATP